MLRARVFAAALVCAAAPAASQPLYFDVDGYRDYLGAAWDDPMCEHMRAVGTAIEGEAAPPDREKRIGMLDIARVEADVAKNGDILWPFRKALICAYLDAADEEKAEFRYTTVDAHTCRARWAAENMPSEDGLSPLVPVYDHNSGRASEPVEPVDTTVPDYCDSPETAERALTQIRAELVQELAFVGSLRRAPDWYAHLQLVYHRWALAHSEYRYPGFDGEPDFCRRFHATWSGSKEFAVKDVLIFSS